MRRGEFDREVGHMGNVLFLWAVMGIFGGLIVVWMAASWWINYGPFH